MKCDYRMTNWLPKQCLNSVIQQLDKTKERIYEVRKGKKGWAVFVSLDQLDLRNPHEFTRRAS